MTVYRISIDEGNAGKNFWTGEATELWDSIPSYGTEAFFLTKEEAEVALAKFRSLPYWNEGTEKSPHPIVDDIYEGSEEE